MTVIVKRMFRNDCDDKRGCFRVMVTIKRMFQSDGDNKEGVSG